MIQLSVPIKQMKQLNELYMSPVKFRSFPYLYILFSAPVVRSKAFFFGIRKDVFEYDQVLDQQRQVIYALRRKALLDSDAEVLRSLQKFCEETAGGWMRKCFVYNVVKTC